MTVSAPFVLIRGLLRDTRHWGMFVRQLQQQFPQAEILTPDIPGNGRLYHLTSPDTVAGMTEALRNQVATHKQLRLIAISMGGMIAMDWMTRYPDEVNAAVLINSSAKPVSPFYYRLRWTAYPHMIKMTVFSILQGKIDSEADILALTSNRHERNGNLLACWQQWRQQYPVSVTSAKNQLLAAVRFSITTPPSQPVLVIASRTDRLVDYRCSRELAKNWRADYLQHATAGHDLPLDEPEWLAHAIRQWFVCSRESLSMDSKAGGADSAQP